MQRKATITAVKAGILYFILIFAARFVLGLIRIKLIVPSLGEIAGLLIELPVVLVWAWIACGWTIRRLRVPTQTPARIVMGVLALILVLIAETLVAVSQSKSVIQHFASYNNVPMLIGLAVQLAFAAMPWLRLKYVLPRRFE